MKERKAKAEKTRPGNETLNTVVGTSVLTKPVLCIRWLNFTINI